MQYTRTNYLFTRLGIDQSLINLCPLLQNQRAAMSHHPPSDSDSTTSYEKAVLSSDAHWEWHTAEQDGMERGKVTTKEHVMPKHVSSPVTRLPSTSTFTTTTYYRAPRLPSGEPMSPTQKLQSAGGVDVVTSSPTNVRVGFFTTASIEATNPSELPGSRTDGKVITTPPHPSAKTSSSSTTPSSNVPSAPASLQRVESIEDAGKNRENYAPQLVMRELNFEDGDEGGEMGPNTFCLDFASLMSSQSWRGFGQGNFIQSIPEEAVCQPL